MRPVLRAKLPALSSRAPEDTPGLAKVVIGGGDQPIAIEVCTGVDSSEPPALRLPSLERVQWEYIHAVLNSCAGNVSEAARQLGIHRQSLQRMLRRHPPNR
jgi:transcriptional regulator of acetoin/glycerol metabolism